ncbi:MAG: DUF2167 domain-containing protein [Myxococcales bacterium]|nr:DUF2167 domain-containing protein [Myxococcales bacterium]MCB9566627.1 DUF2167 domain-containing protein [Myxococcales bacterium]MCB9704358.1 DUF2167 domain-containing protein [Myxococcales bacterium]
MSISWSLPLALVLASADIAPPPTTADAALDQAPATDVEEPREVADEPVDPMFAAVMAALDDEARAALAELDEAAMSSLLDRAQRGEPLTPVEEKIASAIRKAAIDTFDAGLGYQRGDVTIRDGLAVLHLGDEFRYLGPADAERVLTEGWGNPPGSETLGMIVPADLSPIEPLRGWGVIITYSEEGHVSDDDADEIDYDELLSQLKEGTEAGNTSRTAQGYPAMHLVGWAEQPRYAREIHSLYWAQELEVDGAPEHSLNYAIRVLGRKGVLELNAVSGIGQLAAIRPEMEKVYALVEFNEGNRYIDFDPDIDDVATYGIAGLIAGKVATKVGLWAGLMKLLIAGKKLLIFLALGLVAGAKALFGRKKAE